MATSMQYVQIIPCQTGIVTTAAPLNSITFFVAPQAGTLVAAYVTDTNALSANDTNYITYTVTNTGQAGAGTTTMATVHTKATAGHALDAGVPHEITLSATSANLLFVAGDIIKVTAVKTASGTMTQGSIHLHVIYGQG